MKIVKRDGAFEEFNLSKIENAVLKAYKANNRSTLDIPTFLKDDFVNCYTVEQIQDKVVDILRHKDPEIAESYQTYRLEHQKIRNVDKVIEDFSKFINKENSSVLKEAMTKLFGLNIENQNANVDEYSFGGRTGEMTRVITKYIALNYIISDMARSNHVNNEIYIHDLDSYAVGSHNCLTIPFSKLLKEGFVTRNASVRPAKSLKAACQLIAVIFQCQSQCQFGGCAAGTIDWDLIPYLRMSFAKHYAKGRKWFDGVDQTITNPEEYEILDTNIYDLNSKAYRYAKEMINEELAQSMESLYHNLNTLQSRGGDQLPFTSINYGTCTLIEGRMITRALLEAIIKGVGKLYETSIFPCGIFQYKKGINDKPGTPNYDLKILAIKAMTQRIYPNWANCDWSVNANCDPENPKTWMATMGK